MKTTTPAAAVQTESTPDKRIKTHISRAYWCDPGKHYTFEPACINFLDHGEQTGWLDHLLGGGIYLPDGIKQHNERALSMLLSGSPGSGKSTLALELCTRWSKVPDANNPNLILKNRGLRTLYVTTEAHGKWMKDKPKEMLWPGYDCVHELGSDKANAAKTYNATDDGAVHIWSVMDDKEFVRRLNAHPAQEQATGSGIVGKIAQHSRDVVHNAATVFSVLRELMSGTSESETPHPAPAAPSAPAAIGPGNLGHEYDVLVFDSVNTVADRGQREILFDEFKRFVSWGFSMVIFVADSKSRSGTEDFWDFMSDLVIRLTRTVDEERYMVRTIEVTKARYQSHVWGLHQLKPYGAHKVKIDPLRKDLVTGSAGDRAKYFEQASERMRDHPYRQRGGIFIFPSIHFILSQLKKLAPITRPEMVSSALPGLEKLLVKGYPRRRCTALIGCHGGHKSHLAFVEAIHRLVHGSGPDENGTQYCERVLIITLRDDEGMTRETMQHILLDRHGDFLLEQHKPVKNEATVGMQAQATDKVADRQLRQWESEGRLEISYFPPGYITPEEFFHRLLLSLNRLKGWTGINKNTPHVTVVVNSLDQLSSRFPLCAAQEIFVPGIVQVLSYEGASSFFVAAERLGRPGLYGLDTMAELIMEFSLKQISGEEHQEVAKTEFPNLNLVGISFPSRHTIVMLRVARFAGGQAAGKCGILELVDDSHPLGNSAVPRNLHCLPIISK